MLILKITIFKDYAMTKKIKIVVSFYDKIIASRFFTDQSLQITVFHEIHSLIFQKHEVFDRCHILEVKYFTSMNFIRLKIKKCIKFKLDNKIKYFIFLDTGIQNS